MTVAERSVLGAPARYAGGLHELAQGTWAWLQPNGGWGESNAGLIAGDGEALLIDSQWDLQLAERMLDAMRAAAGVPIRTIVNTHADGDHMHGNQLVPDAEIVGTERTAEAMKDEDPAGLQRFRSLSQGLAGKGDRHAMAVRFPGRAFAAYIAAMLGPYDFRGIHVTPPTRTFSGELTLDVGGREVRLVEVGPAHTAGDTVVLVPDARVAFAADVMFAGVVPVMWAGPLANWLEALDLLLEAEVDTIVPGHGPICGKAEVALVRDYWTWLDGAARPLLAGGVSPERAAAQLASSDAYRAAPWAAWDCPERILINLVALDHERRGTPLRLGSVGRARLFAKVATFARSKALTEGR